MGKLFFAAFKGKSVVSRLIKFWTRSEYSHIAIISGDGLIEAWNHNKGFEIYWGFSNFFRHKENTVYEIWMLPMANEEESYCMSRYISFAENKRKYDWKAIIGFIFKIRKDSNVKAMCSEGAIEPILAARGFETIIPHQVSPSDFVNLIEAMGGRKLRTGKVTTGR